MYVDSGRKYVLEKVDENRRFFTLNIIKSMSKSRFDTSIFLGFFPFLNIFYKRKKICLRLLLLLNFWISYQFTTSDEILEPSNWDSIQIQPNHGFEYVTRKFSNPNPNPNFASAQTRNQIRILVL